MKELAKDGKDRVLEFNWGEWYKRETKVTAHDVDSGDFKVLVATGCIDPHLNLTPSLQGTRPAKVKKYLKILEEWHKGPEVGKLQNLSHKVTYTKNNPSQGHFKQPKFNYSYADSDEYGRVNTYNVIERSKKESASDIANWIVKLLKTSDKELDNPVLRSLREALQG